MFTADKIVNHFSKVYNEKVIPRIKQKAINEYKEEIPLSQPSISDESSNNKESNRPKHQERLAKFMEKCDDERQAFIAKKDKTDSEKLEKILLYVRNTSDLLTSQMKNYFKFVGLKDLWQFIKVYFQIFLSKLKEPARKLS